MQHPIKNEVFGWHTMPYCVQLCQEFSFLVLVFVSRCQSLHSDALAIVELLSNPSAYPTLPMLSDKE